MKKKQSESMEIEIPYSPSSILAFESDEVFHIISEKQAYEQLETAKQMLSSEALWVEGSDICRSVIVTLSESKDDAQDLTTQAWSLLGSFFDYRHEIDKAFWCYNKALEIDPECFQAHKKKGLLFHKTKNFLESIHCLEQAAQHTTQETSKAKVLMLLGNIHAYPQIKDDKKALIYFEQAWDLIEAMDEKIQNHVLQKRKIESYFFFCALMRNRSSASAISLLPRVYEKNMKIFDPSSLFYQDMFLAFSDYLEKK